ncbi:hypothetical protein LEP1GSC132_4000 [Leptospira kirschneri str. 200803703]|uniref:Uncharacterized protein n=1 Tax=Leptospira kirschneri str. 200802841 TaxID=1193047 RepID=A0A828Y1W1_9LEPT|nr:hypothetical protein LEP1GSC044_1388 [Leptospira kirschneri serovar Grippotyphosa str. RM52]EKO51466.1 hypothetical protein LEP1GSC131_1876 [Leptospira kirschneri str. 200802841]EKP05750.1 hypothetical protein LEP1GSC018_0977 [Leptospira kirschneri str. 2008720114]EKQ82079.1 hypothetical protein LEP1GSC064_3937 [Leptospira kirschneri serovar Grippotyphosa str. Moskva]EKR10249.1 hypothetical protein LEP1GSC122_4112 [Leptospira kirschneri serovar Valbuzzi str. 200702274]EMJ89912.1 hypothetica
MQTAGTSYEVWNSLQTVETPARFRIHCAVGIDAESSY